MRETFARVLTERADRGDDFVLLTADLGYSVLDDFQARHPHMLANMGIAENTMVGVAAGLAMGGNKVFAYGISKFLANKCFEQIREDVCLHDLPVVLVGVGSGFSYGSAGYTHYSTEDVGCLRTIRNLTILAPADPVELRLLLPACFAHPHPIYLRLGKSGERPLTGRRELRIGEAYYVRQGRDVALICHGNVLAEALAAADLLSERSLDVSVVSSPSIVPLDEPFFERLAATHPHLYVVEEHSEVGGLGDALGSVGVSKIAVGDVDLHACGDRASLRAAAGIDAPAICRRVLADLAPRAP